MRELEGELGLTMGNWGGSLILQLPLYGIRKSRSGDRET